jgi:hypothetical protein
VDQNILISWCRSNDGEERQESSNIEKLEKNIKAHEMGNRQR